MSTPRMTEQEWAEHQRRVRISKSNTRVQGGVGGGAIERDSPRKRNGREPVMLDNPAPAPLGITLNGQLPSGKNQVQLLFRNGKVMKYANKTFKTWREQSHAQIIAQANWGARTIIRKPVSLTCEYWPGDARTRDVSGQLDALFHLLVYAKVLHDDGLIYNVTWRRHGMNRKCPKVVMEVRRWEE